MSKKPRKKKPHRPSARSGGMGGMGGAGGGPNMNQMLQQVQQMQEEMAAAQAALAERTVEGSAGGGMVKAVATGRQQVVGINIDPECVDPDDVEMLEDLVLAAVSDALEKSASLAADAMQGPMGGVDLGGIDLDSLGIDLDSLGIGGGPALGDLTPGGGPALGGKPAIGGGPAIEELAPGSDDSGPSES